MKSSLEKHLMTELLTDEQKKELGLDMRSFASRMTKRLQKICQDDGNDKNFLTRHHYQNTHQSA